MIGLLAALGSCFREPPNVNLFELVKGNWTRMVNNVSTTCVMDKIEADSETVTYAGEYEGSALTVRVTSNTTAEVVFQELHRFGISFSQYASGIAYGNAAVSDGSHVTVTAYANQSIELVYAPKDASEILTFGFFKKQTQDYSWKDFAIPTVLALILTFLIRKYLPQFFG